MTNIENSTTQSKAATPDPLAALDLQIEMAQRRLKHVRAERDREAWRGIDRLLISFGQSDAIGHRLLHRLDELVREAECRVAELQEQRAAALLAAIELLESENANA
jgi:hypothetical protein